LADDVHHSDDFPHDVWRDEIGLPPERLVRWGDFEKGDEKNWWRAADIGPRGPLAAPPQPPRPPPPRGPGGRPPPGAGGPGHRPAGVLLEPRPRPVRAHPRADARAAGPRS